MDASNRLLHVYGKTPAGTAALRADRGAMPGPGASHIDPDRRQAQRGDLSKIFPVQTLETALAFLDERSYVECLQHFPQDNGGFGNSTRFAELEKPLELPHGATSHLQTRHYVMGGVVVLSLGLLASFYDGLGARRPAEHAPAAPVAVVAAAAPSPESNAAPPGREPRAWRGHQRIAAGRRAGARAAGSGARANPCAGRRARHPRPRAGRCCGCCARRRRGRGRYDPARGG